MARTFRYRYVDIGTVFTGDSGQRDAADSTHSPAILYANELACAVGGSFWGPAEPLAIIDHQSAIQTEFASASAAVLSSACRIREKFASQNVIWLVTHKEPEFDDWCSMYLARWIIEDAGAEGIGRTMAAEGSRIDWGDPDFGSFSPGHRWALLLANYASALEMRRRISCPRQRTLRSVLLAAMKRGRDYLSATSGATELFDEVKAALQERQLNPVFDSVLEGNARFAPELAMLDREAEAYARDLERARKAIVYLPESEAPSPDFFEHPKPHADIAEGGDDLLLEETFRIATDGIYLRDPECELFSEWARVDVQNSALGKGFEFSALAYSEQRPEAAVNTSGYVFSIDPERADGRHLYTVWSRLQTEEVEALRAPSGEADVIVEQRHEALAALLSDPWTGGDRRSSTLIEAPKRGTQIAPPGRRRDLCDDPVVEAVRTELENAIYTGSSRMAGPRTSVHDVAGRAEVVEDAEPRYWELNDPIEIPPPDEGHFRFASVGLRTDVLTGEGGVAGERLTTQVAETLWRILYPEAEGLLPSDLARHIVVAPDSVGVWSERGIAIAQKARPAGDNGQLGDFAATVTLLRGVDRLVGEWRAVQTPGKADAEERGRGSRPGAVQQFAVRGEALAHQALEVQQMAARPGRELLRRFHEAIEVDAVASRLREMNDAVAGHLRREAEEEEARRTEKRTDEVYRARERVRWLEVFVIAYVALEVVAILLRNVSFERSSQNTLALFGGPVTFGVAVWLIQPWRRKRLSDQPSPNFRGVVIAATVVWLLAWLLQVFRLW